jgi:U5 snRNP spliceosome subunit
MLLVQCVLLVINILVFGNTAAAEENDHTDVHGDITGTGPPGNMFDEVFKYAFKNYYNTPTSKVNSKESQRKSHRNYPRRQHYYYNQPPPPQPYPAQPYPQQFIFPQHYYMPPAAPPMPPYPAYQYPPYYPPHPPPPHHYGYPYSPVKEKSAETKTTQNLWELYQQLKAKFETTAGNKQFNIICQVSDFQVKLIWNWVGNSLELYSMSNPRLTNTYHDYRLGQSWTELN